MQSSDAATAAPPRPKGDFAVEAGTGGVPNMLLFKGRPVVAVAGLAVEAQFGFADGSTLVLISDNTPFKEVLTLTLIGPDLRERDRVLVGGAYPQGFLAYAERHGPDEVAFCWHDLDLVAVVRRYWSWFKLRRRWLRLRDTVPQRAGRAPAPRQ